MTLRAAQLALICASIATAACGSEPRPKSEPSPVPALAVEAPKPALAAATEPRDPTADELPLPQDFEAEVAAQITAANFRAELSRLEAAITAK